MENNFNIILSGVGGQGIITLLMVIDEAALVSGFDVKSSELHGLSQRGGSVEAHIRFGKSVNSPMVATGQADLILSTEMTEGLRESVKAGKQTKFLINEHIITFDSSATKENVTEKLKLLKNEMHLVPASEACKNKLQNEIVCTMYLLGYGVSKGLLPFKKEMVLKAIKNVIPEKYLDLNINAFELGYGS